MSGYGQFCPIAVAAEVFAERWTPIIVRNLAVGCTRFGEILDGAPGLPRSVLSARLRKLERVGVIVRRDGAYELTDCGHELVDVCLRLGAWGARWLETLPSPHDPYLALWTVARLVEPESLPRPRVVVRFDLTDGSRPPRYWLVLGADGNEVCVEDPRWDDDGVVRTDARWLARWVSGVVPFGLAQRSGGMVLNGPGWLGHELGRWGRLSPFADVRPARELAGTRPRARITLT
jgi:DNA-binding HxlR family transcriptional regulator